MWKDNLRKASFRGVEFGVTDTSLEGGRRTAIHEFPNKESSYVEDLGRKSKSFSVEAFIVGDDYMADRDLLIEALDEVGPGILIHPYYGKITVQVGDYSIHESKDDGGMVTFSIQFQEASDVLYPKITDDLGGILIDKSSAIQTSIIAQLAPSITGGQNVQTKTTDKIKESTSRIDSLLKGAMSLTYEIDSFTRKITDYTNNLTTLIQTPGTLIENAINIMSSLQSVMDPIYALRAYSRIFDEVANFFNGLSFLPTSTDIQVSNNLTAYKLALLISTATNSAQIAGNMDFESREQANSVRDSLSIMFDALLPQIDDDTLFQSLTDLKVTTLRAIPPEGETLKDEKMVSIKTALPSLVVAYSLYGSSENEQEIISRNHIQNPFSIPAGSKLDILI